MEEKKNLATTYNPKEFEERIYKTWEEKKNISLLLLIKLKAIFNSDAATEYNW